MSEFLEVHRENAEDLLEESLPLLLSRRLGYRDLLAFCEYYRIKGIVHLLLDLEPDRLCRNLQCSGRAFSAGLASLPPGEIVVSQALPLFDAIASGDLAGATSIARSLPSEWQSEVEYQDDFLWVRFACDWLLGQPWHAEQWARFEEAAPPDHPQFALCRSLQDGDAIAFDAALRAFLMAHQERLMLLARRGRLSDESAATLPYFSAEGLAWLRLAERGGLVLPQEYPLVPSVARGDFASALADEAWKSPRTR